MLSGRSVFVVEALDAAMVSVSLRFRVSNRPAVESNAFERTVYGQC
jgi:hypothetical protein